MTKYENIKNLPRNKFRRLTGIFLETFEKMLEILLKKEQEQKNLGDRKNKLSMADRLLMTLEYLREYRTYFHIAKSYGISESAVFCNIRWIENTLIKSGEFNLPGKKILHKSEHEIILIDVTECPIERPKKNVK